MPSLSISAPRCARSILLLQHKGLVNRAAWRLKSRLPRNVELDDLVQAGMLGLNDALSKFDVNNEAGASFDTYAYRRIAGAMLDELRSADELPRQTRADVRKVRSAVRRLEHRLCRAPRTQEIATELGWALQEVHDTLVQAGAAGTRLEDMPLEAGDESSASGNALEDAAYAVVDDNADPQRTCQQRQRHAALNDACQALPERERHMMHMLYVEDQTRQDAAAALGVSPSRVSQMHDEVVAKLKRMFRVK